MSLAKRQPLTIRPKSDIERMTLVSLLALFGIERNRLELSHLAAEEKEWVLRDCRAEFLKQMNVAHPDHGGETEQAEHLNLAFARVTHLLVPKPFLRPEREVEPKSEPTPLPAPTPKPARTLKRRPCVVCGSQCSKGRTTCSAPCLAQRRSISGLCISPEQREQNRRDYLARTGPARKKVVAAWWAANAARMAEKRRGPAYRQSLRQRQPKKTSCIDLTPLIA